MSDAPRTKRPHERITAEFNLPGKRTDVRTGETPVVAMPKMHVFAYGPTGFVEKDIADPVEMIEYIAKWPVTWIMVDPLDPTTNATGVVERFGQILSLHELEIEDLVNVHQRAKVEEYGEHLFVVTRMMVSRDATDTEQLSLILGKNFVVTFREVATDCLDPVRDKIRKGRGRIRNEQADYLMYAIIDAVVDGYFPLLSGLADRLDKMEDEVIDGFEKDTPARMYELRRDILSIRRAIWPTREAVSTLYRDTIPLVSNTTRLYLRDCYDHSVRIIDLVEMYREVASALMEVHFTRASNRLNEVMKVLTIITTVFIPPSFIAGVYGMNFNGEKSPLNMPELNWYFGYPAAICVMFLLAMSLICYLYWKGWLSDKHDRH